MEIPRRAPPSPPGLLQLPCCRLRPPAPLLRRPPAPPPQALRSTSPAPSRGRTLRSVRFPAIGLCLTVICWFLEYSSYLRAWDSNFALSYPVNKCHFKLSFEQCHSCACLGFCFACVLILDSGTCASLGAIIRCGIRGTW